MDFTISAELEWLLAVLTNYANQLDVTNISSLETLWSLVVKELADSDLVIQKIKEMIPTYLVRLIPNYEEIALKDLVYYLNRIRSLAYARAIYTPEKKIRSKGYFFKAILSDLEREETWNLYAENTLQIVNLEGDHFSIFQEPENIEFSNKLRHLLQEFTTY